MKVRIDQKQRYNARGVLENTYWIVMYEREVRRGIWPFRKTVVEMQAATEWKPSKHPRVPGRHVAICFDNEKQARVLAKALVDGGPISTTVTETVWSNDDS